MTPRDGDHPAAPALLGEKLFGLLAGCGSLSGCYETSSHPLPYTIPNNTHPVIRAPRMTTSERKIGAITPQHPDDTSIDRQNRPSARPVRGMNGISRCASGVMRFRLADSPALRR